MKTGILIQARNESTRLPGKATNVYIGGMTPLELVIRRLSGVADKLVIAVPYDKAKDFIAIARRTNSAGFVTHWYYGSPTDLASRRFHAMLLHRDVDAWALAGADDCLIDAAPFRAAFTEFETSGSYYHKYVQTVGWPVGGNAQVVTGEMLADAHANTRGDEREHLTLYFDRNPDYYARRVVPRLPDRGDVRLTLDTPADLALMNRIVTDLGWDASQDSIIEWWDAHPEWQVRTPHYVPVGTPVPEGHPLIRVGHDPARGAL